MSQLTKVELMSIFENEFGFMKNEYKIHKCGERKLDIKKTFYIVLDVKHIHNDISIFKSDESKYYGHSHFLSDCIGACLRQNNKIFINKNIVIFRLPQDVLVNRILSAHYLIEINNSAKQHMSKYILDYSVNIFSDKINKLNKHRFELYWYITLSKQKKIVFICHKNIYDIHINNQLVIPKIIKLHDINYYIIDKNSLSLIKDNLDITFYTNSEIYRNDVYMLTDMIDEKLII